MKESIDLNNLPAHISVIMDGNGRWAKQKGFTDRIFGHRNAIQAVRETIEGCGELGVKYLTLYAFSTENWNRPKAEVMALMSLLVSTINEELPTMMKNQVRLKAIGNIESLPDKSQRELLAAMNKTANNTGLTLVLALSYSGKWDLVQAAKKLAEKVEKGELKASDIDDSMMDNHLSTAGMPDPDLMIRTGGDHRISNFMLWQLAYAELYIFEDLFWPDFRKVHLYQAIVDFQMRERRFGKTSEQVKSEG
ncbi:Ditrans,polycis-undecaprenyl-diphosphate synthase ((2E,6E)-farnesyl-diphosphate specific) [Aquirufa nivalisilvae]|uniref:Isoprenyl transferase n=1 Tax=Aquirufa nivalisilvae TaxID=2516557 RepID=A0A2S2DUK1_9BACT|nr:isoprenyl transferase [Aquirufa nivalisilvae]AWL08720.1 Ditrans,polycis-undecaprenyl-diphosphate synthase ((2E,6E)-farnesyl-diphosphate specific) [Aquirufa nivalisilvae]TBH74746.1 isoprenyl transferase [Aquirufa nivalisilvae]